ncbi:MAG TPA: XTP/dITP diphosphatase [Candidatus Binatia bacterium]|nr:XTP/dITP diphosphatase [Candidatus Binatia bacterium]
MQLLVGTTNPGKLAEVRTFLQNFPVQIISLHDLGRWPEIVEDGTTFEENALKKARTLAEFFDMLALADDSGLEVDALNGEPGIYSSRYGGEEGNDEKNNEKLLNALKDVSEEERTARFVCALMLCAPKSQSAKQWIIRESCEGRIAFNPKGQNGFGYDPLFFYPPFGKTFGQIDRETKATVSHRGKALKKLVHILPSFLDFATKP